MPPFETTSSKRNWSDAFEEDEELSDPLESVLDLCIFKLRRDRKEQKKRKRETPMLRTLLIKSTLRYLLRLSEEEEELELDDYEDDDDFDNDPSCLEGDQSFSPKTISDKQAHSDKLCTHPSRLDTNRSLSELLTDIMLDLELEKTGDNQQNVSNAYLTPLEPLAPSPAERIEAAHTSQENSSIQLFDMDSSGLITGLSVDETTFENLSDGTPEEISMSSSLLSSCNSLTLHEQLLTYLDMDTSSVSPSQVPDWTSSHRPCDPSVYPHDTLRSISSYQATCDPLLTSSAFEAPDKTTTDTFQTSCDFGFLALFSDW